MGPSCSGNVTGGMPLASPTAKPTGDSKHKQFGLFLAACWWGHLSSPAFQSKPISPPMVPLLRLGPTLHFVSGAEMGHPLPLLPPAGFLPLSVTHQGIMILPHEYLLCHLPPSIHCPTAPLSPGPPQPQLPCWPLAISASRAKPLSHSFASALRLPCSATQSCSGSGPTCFASLTHYSLAVGAAGSALLALIVLPPCFTQAFQIRCHSLWEAISLYLGGIRGLSLMVL